MYYASYQTPWGVFYLIEDNEKLVSCSLVKPEDGVYEKETRFLTKCCQELTEYFEGKRKEFTIELYPQGTPFQQKVWRELQKIPYGKTCSYQDIARKIGNHRAYQAVGQSIHNNPLPFFIPCHRVIGKNKKLTGYALGLDLKKYLLELEKRTHSL